MLDQLSAHGTGAEPPPSLGSAVRKLGRLFEEAGLGSPQLDARILVAEACGRGANRLILDVTPLFPPMRPRKSQVSRQGGSEASPCRASSAGASFGGFPLRYRRTRSIPGRRRRFWSKPCSAMPRRRALAKHRFAFWTSEPAPAASLALCFQSLPHARGIGLDRSEAALAVARDNLSRLGLRDRASFLCGDWISAIGGGAFDVIVCNPPYIAPSEICQLGLEVRAYDPYLALDGGEDGLEAYRIIVPQAFAALRKGGLLVFEVGHRQSETVLDLMKLSSPRSRLFRKCGFCRIWGGQAGPLQ